MFDKQVQQHDNAVATLLDALAEGAVEVIDLTQPLSPRTPVMRVPDPFVNTRHLRMHEISHYDDRGPRWRWHDLELGEHVGTHLDAPIHWVSGQDGEDVASVPLPRLMGPVVVVDRSEQVSRDEEFLLTREDLVAELEQIGPVPKGAWLLMRTGWSARVHDEELFLNIRDGRSRTPGIASEAAQWIAEESPFCGVGVETVGTDAGASPTFDPPTPVHYFMLGNGKYGVTQLANLDRLPSRGAMIVVAPLKLVDGTGSPARVLALVPTPLASRST